MEEDFYDYYPDDVRNYWDYVELKFGARFTWEESDLLKCALYRYATDDVLSFIKAIEPLCRYKYRSLKGKLPNVEVKQNRKKIMKSLEETLCLLRHMLAEDIKTSRPYFEIVESEIPNIKLFPEYNVVMPDWHEKLTVIEEAACNAIDPLQKVLDHLVEFEASFKSSSKGRKKADSDDFYAQIAEHYFVYFGKPTSQKDGDFMNVIRILVKAVGIATDSDDPSRGARQALVKLKNTTKMKLKS